MPPTTRKTTHEDSDAQATGNTPKVAESNALAADAVAEEAGGAETQRQVQEKMDADTARGFRGTPVDPTPNENYTVAGVTDPGKHVPEEYKIQTGVVVPPKDVVAENA